MPTEYYYVTSPTDSDIANSVHKNASPSRKRDGVETWLLTYTDGHVPAEGILEYHVDQQQKFDGKTKDSTNKKPDPMSQPDLKNRGDELVEAFWDGLSLGVADRVALHEHIDNGLHLLEIGDAPAGRYAINALTTTSQFTAALKTSLLDDIDAMLDDYPHLK